MMTPDIINAALEVGGAIAGAWNIVVLMRDREIKGYGWQTVVYFTIWAAWNLFYYPYLNQPISAFAAAGVILVNGTWLLLALCMRLRQCRYYQTAAVLPIHTRRTSPCMANRKLRTELSR